MSTHRTRWTSGFARLAVLCVMLVALLSVACSSQAAENPAVDPQAAAARRANNLPALTIVSPTEGSTVTSPFTVNVEAENLELASKGAVRDGEAHLHVMTDGNCILFGEVIDDSSGHVHYGDGAADLEIDLPPGDYDLCVQAGDGFHVALDIVARLSVTVAG